ncbi:MAG: CNNM domain-containing protein [Candidatus Thermoplasmatota archaeon]|nr:CNNM domain-containing protein [Candidatus Thermoplasmatota archaeon]
MTNELFAAAGVAVSATGEGDMGLLIFYITLALGVSFMCSILEAVVLSTPQTYVNILKNEGKRTAAMWAHLKDDDSVRPLTAILTLNTIAHTMGAAGVGSQVQQIWGVEVLTAASAILTLAVLFLSEIIPKTLGAAYWKRLSTPTAYLLTWFTKTLFFLIGPIQMLKSILPSSKNAMVTRDDVAAMADLGEIEGALEENEETIIHNLLGLREVSVHEEMTPRTVVSAFEMHQSIKEILDDNTILRFSRIPVYDETIDNVRGLVIRSEILMAASRDEWDLQLKDIMKPILKIEQDSTIEQALDVFLTNKQQFALVRDEFGGTSGILTMEDVMETLLGKEIVDELDEVEDMRELAREQAAQTEDE